MQSVLTLFPCLCLIHSFSVPSSTARTTTILWWSNIKRYLLTLQILFAQNNSWTILLCSHSETAAHFHFPASNAVQIKSGAFFRFKNQPSFPKSPRSSLDWNKFQNSYRPLFSHKKMTAHFSKCYCFYSACFIACFILTKQKEITLYLLKINLQFSLIVPVHIHRSAISSFFLN